VTDFQVALYMFGSWFIGLLTGVLAMRSERSRSKNAVQNACRRSRS
jgi:hypothetical protein